MGPQSGEDPTLAARIGAARARGFVGRAAEREPFGAMVDGDDAGAVLWVHGPGGIGKTAPLDRFADDARSAGRIVVRVSTVPRRTDRRPLRDARTRR